MLLPTAHHRLAGKGQCQPRVSGTITGFREVEQTAPDGKTRFKTRIAIFHVTHIWKGPLAPTIEVTAPEPELLCVGPEPSYFKVGNDLLVYARGSQKTGYGMDICNRTRLAQDAKDDLNELGPGQEPPRQPEPK